MKKALVIGCISVLALLAAAYASSDSGQATGHGTFPTHAGEVKEVGHGLVRVGSGKIKPFIWSVYVERGRSGGPPCFAVSVVGPLHEFPDHKFGGPELGETQCGLKAAQQARVVTAPVKDGGSWSAFDIGIAAYEKPVTQVQVMRVDGSSEQIRTRHLGRDLGVPGLGSLHYAVFAVEGCVSKVSGLEKGHVVATASDWECRLG
jgi:hypothetical protein